MPIGQFDVLDIRRDFGWQRGLRVGLGEAVEAGYLRVNYAPEFSVVAFEAAISGAPSPTPARRARRFLPTDVHGHTR